MVPGDRVQGHWKEGWGWTEAAKRCSERESCYYLSSQVRCASLASLLHFSSHETLCLPVASLSLTPRRQRVHRGSSEVQWGERSYYVPYQLSQVCVFSFCICAVMRHFVSSVASLSLTPRRQRVQGHWKVSWCWTEAAKRCSEREGRYYCLCSTQSYLQSWSRYM